MKTLCIFLVIAVIAENALCLSFTPRRKRQSPQDEENSLDDRYGWDRPQNRPWNQGRPNQGRQRRPNQDQNWQRPNEGQNNWQRPNQGEAPWMRPNQGQDEWNQNQFDPDRPNQNQLQSTTPSATGGTTTQSAALRACIRNCPVTSEYNPVCGSNGQTYTNPGGLVCAQSCGINVSLQRSSPCPTSTTAAPSK